MKKKYLIIVFLLILSICLLPIPKWIHVESSDVKVKGMFFDFLFLDDRFLGRAEINGLEYKPFDDYSSYKFMGLEGLYYILSVQRADTVINPMDMKAIYVLVNSQDSTLQIEKVVDVLREC